MPDVNHVITLGIGTPGDVAHFMLVGLSPSGAGALPFPVEPSNTLGHRRGDDPAITPGDGQRSGA